MGKLQKQAEELGASVRAREEGEERLRGELKAEKEAVVRETMRTKKVEAEFEKFKESISDVIRIEFTRILTPSPASTNRNTDRLRESQVSNARSERSIRSRAPLDAGALSSSLLLKLQETKSSLWKMVELNRFLKEENGRLLAQSENETNKYEFAQLELHRDIQMLEDEMNTLVADKEAECHNYDQLLLDLNTRLKERDATIEDLRAEVAEYEAIVNGLKTDFEANNDLNDKKVGALRQSAADLQERIEYLTLNVACLEDKNHELEEKVIEQEGEIVACKEMLVRGERALLDAREAEGKLAASEEALRRDFKGLQERHV